MTQVLNQRSRSAELTGSFSMSFMDDVEDPTSITPSASAAHPNLVSIKCANGVVLRTRKETLNKVRFSRLAMEPNTACEQSDPSLIRILLDSLRRPDQAITVPEGFDSWGALAAEARKLGLPRHADALSPTIITVSCHAALSTGRLNPEVTFRKILRIVISGRVNMCRAVFGDSLNECRDSGGIDIDNDRYTFRFFLKHSILEKAFDQLALSGYRLYQSNTFAPAHLATKNNDEAQFIHHSQYVFLREPKRCPSLKPVY